MATRGPFEIIEGIVSVADTVGAFIAGPDRDGIAGHIQQGYRTRCNQAANVPQWLLNLSVSSRTLLGAFCDPYYAQQAVDGFESAPPFTGGQCDNIIYRIQVEQRRSASGGGFEWRAGFVFTFRGPLTVTPIPIPGTCPEGLLGNTEWRLTSPNETVGRNLNSGCYDVQPSYRFILLERQDGLPDSCGDPDPELRPGPNPPADPGPLPGPEPFDDPQGGPIPEIPIPDFPGPFGDFPISLPPPAAPEIDPSDIPASGGDGLPGLPDAIGNPAGSVEGGGDGEEIDFGTPPPGRVWVGCVVQTTADTRLGNIPGTGPTNTVYPAVLGNVSLRYGAFFSTSKRINSRFTILGRETTALVVDGCFLQSQPGVTLVVRPISAETCPEQTC